MQLESFKINIISNSILKTLLFAVGTCATLPSANAASLSSDSSSMGILTDKEGIAARLAHRHIIVASKWSGNIQISTATGTKQNSPPGIQGGEVNISIPVNDLIVDTPEAAQIILPIFTSAKLWSTDKDKLEPGNAKDVRDNMLDTTQLNAKNFPTITGKGVFGNCMTAEKDSYNCSLSLEIKIREKTVSRQSKITINKLGNQYSSSLVVPYKFTEFGIKPYTAMLGAIAVKDDFVLALKLVATE